MGVFSSLAIPAGYIDTFARPVVQSSTLSIEVREEARFENALAAEMVLNYNYVNSDGYSTRPVPVYTLRL